jgi:hypothetical protein
VLLEQALHLLPGHTQANLLPSCSGIKDPAATALHGKRNSSEAYLGLEQPASVQLKVETEATG